MGIVLVERNARFPINLWHRSEEQVRVFALLNPGLSIERDAEGEVTVSLLESPNLSGEQAALAATVTNIRKKFL